jgi:hypothetical protein
MTNYNRAGNRWTVNELLSLQREFELLGWDIDKISQKHERTPNAIMFKLDEEGFADYNVLYSNYHNLNAKMPVTKSDTIVLDAVDNECDDDITDEDYQENADEEDNDDDDDDVDDDDDDDPLARRVSKIETDISDIKNMLRSFTTKNQLSRLGF